MRTDRGVPIAGSGAGMHRDTRSRLALFVCLAALPAVVIGVLSQRDNAILDAATARSTALPLAVEVRSAGADEVTARYDVGSEGELEYALRLQRPGDVVVLQDVSHRLVPEASGPYLWVLYLGALAAWSVCAFVFVPRFGRTGIPALFVGMLLTALAIAIGGVSPPHRAAGVLHATVDTALAHLWVLAVAFLPLCFVRFAVAFPRPSMPDPAMRRRFAVLWVIGGAVAMWNVVAWQTCFDAPGVDGFPRTRLPTLSLYVLVLAGIATGLLVLARNGRRAPLGREKRQVRWILWAITIGATPYLVLRLLPRLLTWLGVEGAAAMEAFPPAFDRVVEMVIPLGFAIAVVKEQFLDIDVIVRRSAIYLLLGVVMAAIVLGLSALLVDPASERLGLPRGLLWAAAGMAAGLAFRPLRHGIARGIDRTLFRIRHGHDRALKALRGALAGADGQTEIARRIDRILHAVLHPQHRAVLVRGEQGWEAAGTYPPRTRDRALSVLRARRPLDGALLAPESCAPALIEKAQEAPELRDSGVALARGVWRGERLDAAILLGPRETGRHYLEEDLDFLRAASEEIDVALERIELVQRASRESLERRMLARREREKSDLFARLAHDLRTPTTAIALTTRNLLEGVLGDLDDLQRSRIASMDAAAAQLTRLTDNLADLGRIELGAPLEEEQAVDLMVVVEEATRALAALAADAEVRFEVRVPASRPAVTSRPGATRQVVINLLDNALKHAPPGSAVEIALEGEDEFVHLRIRDHGAGLHPDARHRVFDLFHQEGGSGETRRRGFGVGLYIVKVWMESMGGTIEVDQAPGGGAIFTCGFRIWRGGGGEA